MDFVNLKELTQRNIISEESYSKYIVDYAKTFIAKNLKLKIFEIKETGKYGGKIIAREEGSPVNLLVKIVITEKCPLQNIEIWPTLKHPNILRLLDKEHLSRIDTHIFITEYHCHNMENFLQSNLIVNNSEAPAIIKRLLRGILKALEYLHGRGHSHLGLIPKNILVSTDYEAIISNFNLLNTANEISNSTKVSLNYGPPEMYFQNDFSVALCGSHYDVWSYGILALNIFTNGYLLRKIPEDADWRDKVFPTLQKILLKMKKFSKYFKKAFRAAKISKDSMKSKINLVITCLRILPTDRPSAHMLLKHKYFTEEGGFITVHKHPWNKKQRIKAKNWIEMLSQPSISTNENNMDKNKSKTLFGESNDKESRKENKTDDDNIMSKNKRSSKSSTGNKQKSTEVEIQNQRDSSLFTNSENESNETEKLISKTEENMSDYILNKLNDLVLTHSRKEIDVVKKTEITLKTDVIFPSSNKINNSVGDSLENNRPTISNEIKKSQVQKSSTLKGLKSLIKNYSIYSRETNINKNKEKTSDTDVVTSNQKKVGNAGDDSAENFLLPSRQNKINEIKKSILVTQEFMTTFIPKKSNNFAKISDLNTEEIHVGENKEIIFDADVTTSNQNMINNSTEKIQVTSKENKAEEIKDSISITQESAINSTSNERNDFVECSKQIQAVEEEITLGTDAPLSTQIEEFNSTENVNDQTSKKEPVHFDEFSVTAIMKFLQPKLYHIDGIPEKFSQWIPYESIGKGISPSIEEDSPHLEKPFNSLSDSELRVDSGKHSVQKERNASIYSDSFAKLSSVTTTKDKKSNEKIGHEFCINQQCKDLEETDWRVIHAIGCTSCSLNLFENASNENKNLLIQDHSEDTYSPTSIKAQITGSKIDNSSEICFSKRESNTLLDKKSFSSSLPKIQNSNRNVSEQTGNNLKSIATIQKNLTLEFPTRSPNLPKTVREYLNQNGNVAETSNVVLPTIKTNVEITQFDVRKYENVTDTILKKQKEEKEKCFGDNASNL